MPRRKQFKLAIKDDDSGQLVAVSRFELLDELDHLKVDVPLIFKELLTAERVVVVGSGESAHAITAPDNKTRLSALKLLVDHVLAMKKVASDKMEADSSKALQDMLKKAEAEAQKGDVLPFSHRKDKKKVGSG